MSLSQRINKLWRIFATGFCFLLFALGGLVLTFFVFPFFNFFIRNAQRRELKVQRIIQKSFFLFCETMRLSGTMDYKFVGIEKLKTDKKCLIVANHPSLIDYVLITSQLSQCDCLVKGAVWHNLFMRGVVRPAGYIPNINPESLLTECSKRFDSDNVMLIFPEGTRTTQGEQPVLQRGAAQVAVNCQCDLRVVHITVSPPSLTKQKKWYQVADKKPFFLLQVMDKIAITPFIDEQQVNSISVRKLNRHLATVLFPS